MYALKVAGLIKSSRRISAHFGGQRFKWDFVTANIPFLLLGADFLCAHNLLVDVKNNRMVDTQTFSLFACAHGEAAFGGLSSSLSGGNEFQHLLREFLGLTQTKFSAVTAKHGVEYHIDTKGPPVYATARQLDPDRLKVARSEFANMERLCIIRRSDSPWASPLLIVPKPDGGW